MIQAARSRLAGMALVCLGLSLLAFGLSALTPGDPATILLHRQTGEPPTEEAIRAFRTRLGLDAPFPLRYARWLGDAVRGDLGLSYTTGRPVGRELLAPLRNTAVLAVPALAVALAIAFPLGIVAALRRGALFDHLARLSSLLGASIPAFWLAYLLMLALSVHLRLLPAAGSGSLAHAVLPVLTLAVSAAAPLTRLVRASLLEALGEDYVRTARALGQREAVVVLRHALPNALVPVVTVASLRLGHLLSGAIVLETVFAWPGIGTRLLSAIQDRDTPMIQGFVLLSGVGFVLLNGAVDLLYRRLDPRVRAGALADAG